MKNETMKRTCCLASAVFALFCCAADRAQAEETNIYPKSRLELFEERSGVVLIRGTDEVGVVPGKNGGVAIKLRETRDMTTGQREFGVFVTVSHAEGVEDTTVVDYDELDALIRNIDYVNKVEWSVSSLSHFEASYTTRAGFKVATYSSRRTGTIEAAATCQRNQRVRSNLTLAQLAQLRVTLELAKTKIEEIQKGK